MRKSPDAVPRGRGFGDRVGEVLQHEQHASAAVVHLMGEFARCIKRIDIHNDIAADQRTKHNGGIGHDIGHHNRNAITFLQA